MLFAIDGVLPLALRVPGFMSRVMFISLMPYRLPLRYCEKSNEYMNLYTDVPLVPFVLVEEAD